MDKNDLKFVPHSDVGAFDLDTLSEHKNLIEDEKYSDATALLETKGFNKGVRASFLNSIQNKLRELQLYFLNEYVAERDEYFATEEPDPSFMEANGYTHWLKPW